jgi:hypothetical protein
LEELFRALEEQVEIDTTKGILKVILAAAIFMALVVSICTLIRWIIFTLNERSRTLNEEEWNFTKIEERMGSTPRTGSPLDHYERLPCLDGLGVEGAEEDDTAGNGVGGIVRDVGGIDDATSVHTTRSEVDRTVEVHSGKSAEECSGSSPRRSTASASVSLSSPRSPTRGMLAPQPQVRAKKEAEEEGVGKPPKMTFYDEMIGTSSVVLL